MDSGGSAAARAVPASSVFLLGDLVAGGWTWRKIIPFLKISPGKIDYLDYSKGFNHWDTLEL
jgi:hypothetical protein